MTKYQTESLQSSGKVCIFAHTKLWVNRRVI